MGHFLKRKLAVETITNAAAIPTPARILASRLVIVSQTDRGRSHSHAANATIATVQRNTCRTPSTCPDADAYTIGIASMTARESPFTQPGLLSEASAPSEPLTVKKEMIAV